jgi:hypothetical protein
MLNPLVGSSRPAGSGIRRAAGPSCFAGGGPLGSYLEQKFSAARIGTCTSRSC